MKTLLKAGFVITCSAALIACGGSSSSGDKSANNSPNTSSNFKSPEGAAVAAAMGVGFVGMGNALARDTVDLNDEEETLSTQRMIRSGDDSMPCDSGSHTTSTGVKASPHFEEKSLFNNLDTEVNTFNNCSFSSQGFSAKINGRSEIGDNGDAFYAKITDLSGSLSTGYYTSSMKFGGDSMTSKMRIIQEGKETQSSAEYYSYADMDISFSGEKLKLRMGANPTTPLIVTTKDATGGFEESTIDGYLGVTINPQCSFAATYKTIEPLWAPIADPDNDDADDTPIAGEVNISIEGDKSYHVKFDSTGVWVDGQLFTEQDLDNQIGDACGD